MKKQDWFNTVLWTLLCAVFCFQHAWAFVALSVAGTLLSGWLGGLKWYHSKVEIKSRDKTRLYLTRYFLFGGTYSRYALMLHHMHMPDDDACHHDHPWWFITCVLKGGYIEEVARGFAERVPPNTTYMSLDEDTPDLKPGDKMFSVGVGPQVETVFNRPGVVWYRPATHAHRIASLPTGSCWTLVLRGQKQRSWGFHADDGWVWWQDFIRSRKAVAWCVEAPMRGYRWLDGANNEIVVPGEIGAND